MRVKIEDIFHVWKNTSMNLLKNVLLLTERAVLQPDEDTITLSIEASRQALRRAGVDRDKIEALYLGTCTDPYDSRPSATIIAEAIGIPNQLMCADIQFAGKSGTAALQVCLGLVGSGMIEYGLAIGADTMNRHSAPGDWSEYSGSAGAVALVVGKEKPIVEVEATLSYATSFTDYFRLEGERYVRMPTIHAESLFEFGYKEHVVKACEALMRKMDVKAEDYTYAVFQQPNGVASFGAGGPLGFKTTQIAPGVVANQIGDCGAASSFLGLANVLDRAKSGDRILLASYGFGAGSDVFSLRVMPQIEDRRGEATLVKDLLENKLMTDYATAMKNEYKYVKVPFAFASTI
jgi:hydroxymethylglutaryl-CoA synthase